LEFEPVSGQPMVTDLALHETGFLQRRPHWNYQNVFSPFWRLYYDLEPGHRVIFPGKEVTLGPDRLVLIPDHQLFHSLGTEAKPKLWMHFSRELQLMSTQPIPIVLEPTATERSLLQDLVRVFRASKEPPNRYRIFHLSIALLHLVLSRPEIVWQSEAPANLLEAVRYVEKHYASPLYTKDLARFAHLSESVFRRKFQQFRNVAPAQFIAQVRVREAAHLLTTTTLDMSDIAERTGFPNPAYLSRVFKSVTGRTPARFRRESRGLQLDETRLTE
jgi:AraC-like DNA-binding protein